MSQDYDVIDLFSGSGGSARGFQDAGFKIKAAVEINDIAMKTFLENFPQTIAFKDIKDVSGKEIMKKAGLSSNNTVIIACPPCQGFSTARRQSQRVDDPRNDLIDEFVRITEEIMPIAFVMENVPGLAKGIGRKKFQETKHKLTSLGYFMVESIVDAADYGVPQRRKRLVLIGTRNRSVNLKFPHQTHCNPESDNIHLPRWTTVWDTIGNLSAVQAGQTDKNDTLHAAANLSDLNLHRMKVTPKDGGSRDSWPEDLVLECHKRTNGFTDIYGRMRKNSPSPTITGGCSMISKGRFGHPIQNRAISLREAALLQSFPPDFRFIGNFGEKAKQIGNAVPPLLARRIAESLLEDIKNAEKDKNILSKKEINQVFFGSFQ